MKLRGRIIINEKKTRSNPLLLLLLLFAVFKIHLVFYMFDEQWIIAIVGARKMERNKKDESTWIPLFFASPETSFFKFFIQKHRAEKRRKNDRLLQVFHSNERDREGHKRHTICR